MATTIDHAFFPHIFSQIIAECDIATQKTLRFLSSAVKLEVDKLHCRLISIEITWRKDRPTLDYVLPPTDPELGSLVVGSDVHDSLPFPPVLWQAAKAKRDETLQETHSVHPTHAFALRHARSVSIWSTDLLWDHICAWKAQYGGANYTSPFSLVTAPRMRLYLGDISISGGEPTGLPPIAIPATIEELLVNIVHPSSLYDVQVLHNCTAIIAIFELMPAVASHGRLEVDDISPFLVDLIKPCVKRLVILFDRINDAATYVKALGGVEPHPQLQITVWPKKVLPKEKARRLREKLAGMVKAEVEVEVLPNACRPSYDQG